MELSTNSEQVCTKVRTMKINNFDGYIITDDIGIRQPTHPLEHENYRRYMENARY